MGSIKSKTGKAGDKAPKSCRECRHWKEAKERIRVNELLEATIDEYKKKLTAGDFKPTIAEYLKLLQAEQELELNQDGVKEIKVTWVEPQETSPEK